MEDTTSRIGSSSSTMRMRSAGMLARTSVWQIVPENVGIESNQKDEETQLLTVLAMLKPRQSGLGLGKHEHAPLARREYSRRAGCTQTGRSRDGAAADFGSQPARISHAARALSHGLDRRLDRVSGFASRADLAGTAKPVLTSHSSG